MASKGLWRPRSLRSRWTALAAAALFAVALAWWLGASPKTGGDGRTGASASADPTYPGPTRAAAAGRTPTTNLAAVSQPAALAHSSLRGTEADGDWGIDANGRFRPTAELRRRFDYYLSLQGELSIPEITQVLADALRSTHSGPGAAEVMALWSRYLALQQHAWRVVADPRDPATLSAALAERVPVRRSYLGAAAADAFYREEEDDFRDRVARMNAGQPAPAAAEAPTPPLLPDADARLAALRTEQAVWEQRLAASRATLRRIERNPALSPAQREAEVNAHLAQHYAPAEQVRARALLGL